MATCNSKLAAKFSKDCGYIPKQGVTRKWYVNHEDIDHSATQKTNDGTKVTSLVLQTGAKIYAAEGGDKSHKAGHSLAIKDFGNGYIHTDNFTLLYRGEIERQQVQKLVSGARVVTIVEKVDGGKSGEIKYEILGLESGMKITEDTWNSSENSGTALITVATQEGEEEATGAKILIHTDEATTKQFIEGNEYAPVT